MKPLHVALVWHMHQPYYKDDLTQTYLLPWVRLRCAKDYPKMAALLDAYPGIKQTFNLVPSLLAQIEDYTKGEYQDLFLNLSRRPAADLQLEERAFIVRWMREGPQMLRVQSSARYLELASRHEDDPFSVDDIRDLQVWFNLAWFDPEIVDGDPRLSELKTKDSGFTEDDKRILFEIQMEIAATVIPRYRELAQRGQAELTFSPYYHPILPLISHVDSARTASPNIRLPQRHFSHREDAERQIDLGLHAFERMLGIRPTGMWPPEMAVGESVASLAVRAGVDWFISDEEVLARSLETGFARDGEGRVSQPSVLYKPYRMEREGREVSVIFRDSLLSNMIGFDYHRMPALDAAADLMARLRRIREQQADDEYLVTIALDGENAWDFYPRDGHDFLNALYSELEADENIVTTTVSGYLERIAERRPLHRLHTGSWIGASLDTWIGDPEHNVAWDLLAQTRGWLEDFGRHHPAESETVAAAWREIMIAEGSDWFWWYSRKHDSGMDAIWDNQFRLHLRNVYKLVGARPPARLFQPILERPMGAEKRMPQASISPRSAEDPAWAQAGYFEVASGFGALHRPIGLVERILYGADEERVYVRIDCPQPGPELAAQNVEFRVYFSGASLLAAADSPAVREPEMSDLGFEAAFAVVVKPLAAGGRLTIHRVLEGHVAGEVVAERELDSPFYFFVGFQELERSGGEPMELAVVVTRNGVDVEQIPPAGSLGLRLPRRGGQFAETAAPAGSLKVLLVASEMAPFAKSGGVADVVAALAKELRRQGHDARVAMPRYRAVGVERWGLKSALSLLPVPLGTQTLECSVLEGRQGEVPVYFIESPQMFDRDGLYGFGDDDARFVLFSRAVLEMLKPLGWVPDVVHIHDWHPALIPNLIERVYADDEAISGIATALTIHNLSNQGNFGFGTLTLAGLEPWGLIRPGIPHLDDVVNVLGRGIHFTDVFNTVSERYAEEIQTPEYGEGLDELIRAHAHKLFGIVNGIDTELFDPERDPAVPHHYSVSNPEPKALNKAALRAQLGLTDNYDPVIAFISRFYDVKGLDLIEHALPGLLGLDLQFAVLGTGDRRYEDLFRYHAAQSPGRISATIGFDAQLAQRIYAGADMLLMPSRSEPGGLGQLIGLRYGAIPIVRATGGLADTVSDFDPASDSGVGFRFDAYDSWQLFAAVVRALETYRHPSVWHRLVTRAMSEDVSWSRSARRYLQLYLTAIAGRREARGVAPAAAHTG